MSGLRDRIKEKREESGLTQDELAHLLGKANKQTISNWENGRSEPSLADLRMLAEHLRTTVSYLVEGVQNTSAEVPAGFTLVESEEIIKMQRELLKYREQEIKARDKEVERQKVL